MTAVAFIFNITFHTIKRTFNSLLLLLTFSQILVGILSLFNPFLNLNCISILKMVRITDILL